MIEENEKRLKETHVTSECLVFVYVQSQGRRTREQYMCQHTTRTHTQTFALAQITTHNHHLYGQ